MTGPLTPLRKIFDALYEHTSNEPVEDLPYAATRAQDGVYAITNTQSAESTYAAGEFQHERAQTDGPDRRTERLDDSFDCEDPRTCPTCTPRAPTTD